METVYIQYTVSSFNARLVVELSSFFSFKTKMVAHMDPFTYVHATQKLHIYQFDTAKSLIQRLSVRYIRYSVLVT